jgi:hypothetical protein
MSDLRAEAFSLRYIQGALLAAYFLFSILFKPGDGVSMFLTDVAGPLVDYKTTYQRGGCWAVVRGISNPKKTLFTDSSNAASGKVPESCCKSRTCLMNIRL